MIPPSPRQLASHASLLTGHEIIASTGAITLYKGIMAYDSSNIPGDTLALPDVPTLAVAPRRAVRLGQDGDLEMLSTKAAKQAFDEERSIVCHGLFSARRLGLEGAKPNFHFDAMELFAFVRPAQICLPNVMGLASALGLNPPQDLEDEAIVLVDVITQLLTLLTARNYPDKPEARRIAKTMDTAGWPWGPYVMAALGKDRNEDSSSWSNGLDIWTKLNEWQEFAPPAEPGQAGIDAAEIRSQLSGILGDQRILREDQGHYAETAGFAFQPRDTQGQPNIILAEAGTGIGKTAGYIAPASVWAEKNEAPVWISTYTKNLQRQIDQELDHLYRKPKEKAEKVVIRKGRENYLCLLNLQDAVGQGSNSRQRGDFSTPSYVALGLVARWCRYTRDGDMVGGDFPAWLTPVIARSPARVQAASIQATGLTDRRGECVYSACTHYRKCFIEKSVRKSKRATIVVANHALVMAQAAIEAALLQTSKDKSERTVAPAFARVVFDEGHHLFDAADNTFAAHLSGQEGSELRRWIRGPETGRRARGRGLIDRVGDIVGDREDVESALRSTVQAASCLPAPGWMARLGDGAPRGSVEVFLGLVRQHALARSGDDDSPFDVEAEISELTDELLQASRLAVEELKSLARPMLQLASGLEDRLEDEAETLDTSTRIRLDAASRGLRRRASMTVSSWVGMLQSLEGETPEEFVDWFALERAYGRELDVGMYRHWIDPTIPFSHAVLEPSHGTLITSATLRDQNMVVPSEGADPEPVLDWQSAEARTGAAHLPVVAQRTYFPSPFDYENHTRIFVVNDVNRNHADQVAAAFRALFLAAGGGALGLFTAISRLRTIYDRLADPLSEAGLSLFGQHVDAMDTGTLVDLFRADVSSCLLGTDSVRDGVDVPGRSLQLIVFDRVPWPQPSLLHKARRATFGKGRYDDMLTRFKLKQAFGRLIRHEQDKGVFVMLDSRLPSRLLTAFPPEVEVVRCGLAEAVEETRKFLANSSA